MSKVVAIYRYEVKPGRVRDFVAKLHEAASEKLRLTRRRLSFECVLVDNRRERTGDPVRPTPPTTGDRIVQGLTPCVAACQAQPDPLLASRGGWPN